MFKDTDSTLQVARLQLEITGHWQANHFSIYPSVSFKMFHFSVCVPGHEKGWGALRQRKEEMTKRTPAEGGAQTEGLFSPMGQRRKTLAKEEEHWAVLKDA